MNRKIPIFYIVQAYYALLRPHLEFAASSWDPHLKKGHSQTRSSPNTCCTVREKEYNRTPGTVTSLYRDLEWYTLEKRRQVLRLTLFHKALNGNVCIVLPPYIHTKTRHTRSSMRSRLTSVRTSCKSYK